MSKKRKLQLNLLEHCGFREVLSLYYRTVNASRIWTCLVAHKVDPNLQPEQHDFSHRMYNQMFTLNDGKVNEMIAQTCLETLQQYYISKYTVILEGNTRNNPSPTSLIYTLDKLEDDSGKTLLESLNEISGTYNTTQNIRSKVNKLKEGAWQPVRNLRNVQQHEHIALYDTHSNSRKIMRQGTAEHLKELDQGLYEILTEISEDCLMEKEHKLPTPEEYFSGILLDSPEPIIWFDSELFPPPDIS